MTSSMLAERRRFLIDTGLLDREWYAARAPAPLAAGEDVVDHYLVHGTAAGLAPNPQLAALQESGSHTRGTALPPGLVDPPRRDDPRLQADVDLVRSSNLFDEDFYLQQLPKLRHRHQADPVTHFCRWGWRMLLRPYRGFDPWWYWMNHLDPGVEGMNPFVHYLLVGRSAGHSALPRERSERAPASLAGAEPRRICLFAGYDKDGVVDDYVVAYVSELARFADVYYLADCSMAPEELAKLDAVTAGAWSIRHAAYDFGSWSRLASDLVGWDVIDRYDELLLVNDSCYLLRPLDDVFATMDATDCDWWGMQATKGLARTRERASAQITEPVPLARVRDQLLDGFEGDAPYDFHIGSYFLAFRRTVLRDGHLRRLLDSVHDQRSKLLVIVKYEAGLTHYLIGNGYTFSTFADALYPFHPVFTEWYFTMLERGFPLLKKYLLYQNHYDVPDLREWKARVLAVVPEAPVETFEANLLRTAPADALARSFAVVTDRDGSVRVPEIPEGPALRHRDRATGRDDSVWVFVVNVDDHLLSSSARAVLEEVRHDPSVTSVVLTRTRTLHLDGENLTVVPFDSERGRNALVAAGTVLVSGYPKPSLDRLPLDYAKHRLVVVRNGMDLVRFGRAEDDASTAGSRPERLPHITHGVLCSSDLDQLVTMASQHPVTWEQCWRTGLPSTDLLLAERADLPDDLRRQEDDLRERLGGRRLLVFLPWQQGGSAYRFSDTERERLARWCHEEDVVLGLREDYLDQEHAYLRQLRAQVLELSHLRYPDLLPVLRVADALLSDVHGAALDFLATGRPVITFVHDLATLAPRLYVDLDHVMPGPVCRTFEELDTALQRVLTPPDAVARARYARSQRLFFDHLDTGSARRVVDRLAVVDRAGL